MYIVLFYSNLVRNTEKLQELPILNLSQIGEACNFLQSTLAAQPNWPQPRAER